MVRRVTTKVCSKCGVEKPLEEYHRNKNNADGRVVRCKPCALETSVQWRKNNPGAHAKYMKTYHLQNRGRQYGLEPGEWNTMLEAQGGACAICKGTGPGKRLVLCVDHDHVTGVTRALLCHRCNSGLGMFKDNPELLEAAATYLRKWSP
jgi:hypothetical protein